MTADEARELKVKADAERNAQLHKTQLANQAKADAQRQWILDNIERFRAPIESDIRQVITAGGSSLRHSYGNDYLMAKIVGDSLKSSGFKTDIESHSCSCENVCNCEQSYTLVVKW